ncbi:zinc-finger domain protein [Sulfolobus spindle-shaped virus 1]|uniref:Uncharacterized protein A-79 n=1 Tax=Sulfolobus spindle-shape virus 1 TaxID=244589 RepID=A79_SSV1|nr:zinc-finger domain protein [Sulfolobus spindle-shaped virus 1]P20199.1 RecName: Full=Uncharacterized protein A-79 [Sulfolobus spindle-shaped virus 1]CAA30194.1 ORF A-79 [Sulfolobus spindle-shaped virus 1]
MFRCPICGFKTLRLFALKQHTRREHVLVKCPICGFTGKHLSQHFYSRYDIDHLIYCYLFSSFRLPKNVRLAIKRKLEVE